MSELPRLRFLFKQFLWLIVIFLSVTGCELMDLGDAAGSLADDETSEKAIKALAESEVVQQHVNPDSVNSACRKHAESVFAQFGESIVQEVAQTSSNEKSPTYAQLIAAAEGLVELESESPASSGGNEKMDALLAEMDQALENATRTDSLQALKDGMASEVDAAKRDQRNVEDMQQRIRTLAQRWAFELPEKLQSGPCGSRFDSFSALTAQFSTTNESE